MAQCEVCGGHFEERGFQVLVSGRPSAYDRIACAERGRVLAAAGGAAFVHPFKARTIVIDAPKKTVAAVASAGVAGSLLARASLARAKLAFGGTWLLATGMAATSLYLATHPDSAEQSVSSEAAETPKGVEQQASSAPFVHQTDLPPVRVPAPTAQNAAGKAKAKAKAKAKSKPKPQPILVRSTSGNESSPAAQSSPPSPEPSPPAVQPVKPPPAVPATPPVATPTSGNEGSTKPGWGHGDDNHEHGGPPGKDS